MTVLLQHLWPGLAVAALLGFGFSIVFGSGTGLPSARLDVRIGAVSVLAAAVLVSVLQVVPGRPGLWFDILVLCALAYAAGVAAGTASRWALRSFTSDRPREGRDRTPPSAPRLSPG